MFCFIYDSLRISNIYGNCCKTYFSKEFKLYDMSSNMNYNNCNNISNEYILNNGNYEYYVIVELKYIFNATLPCDAGVNFNQS